MSSIDQRTDIQKAVDEIVLERVKKGIMRLERMYGDDWVEKFGGMEDFDIRSGSCCVLGKVYGDYHSGLHQLWPEEKPNMWGESDQLNKNGCAYGFHATAKHHEWDQLQKAWEHELSKRGVEGRIK